MLMGVLVIVKILLAFIYRQRKSYIAIESLGTLREAMVTFRGLIKGQFYEVLMGVLVMIKIVLAFEETREKPHQQGYEVH